MKRVFLLFLSPFLLISSLGDVAFAHQSKQSGDTLVFLHVNPNDQAVANKKGTFYILITKNRYKFPIEECNCTVEILDTKKNVLQAEVFTGDMGKALVPYMFKKPGIHLIRVNGVPKDGQSFEPFLLTFDIRVERGSLTDLLKDKKFLYACMGGILLLSLGFVYTKEYYLDRKRINKK